jgi:hypothetical protein
MANIVLCGISDASYFSAKAWDAVHDSLFGTFPLSRYSLVRA